MLKLRMVLLWAHEKTRFYGKDSDAVKGGRQQHNKKIKYEMDQGPKFPRLEFERDK